MNPRADLALLRRIAAGRESEADRAVLASRLRAYLEGAPAGATLDGTFGVARVPGHGSWWRAEALDARDAALRALAAAFHAGEPPARQAAAIRSALLTYAASAWRLDRVETSPPARYIGTAREMLFDALRACDEVPSTSHIQRILVGSRSGRC
ncbi:hypothetical protein [Methylobacterium frigidaeris]|uniref:Uncharacterized protein n=1 Tax=Methylobacterium frigidaeris TaxID=2038277 RepID=A0AA37HEG7_9HYPH|nr:hypothetical protein [Methylobacterium frigidaeris]GJD64415.1 hypothetical protein MPEAHAMD_4597 [Methylobacterium frigidaeris]